MQSTAGLVLVTAVGLGAAVSAAGVGPWTLVLLSALVAAAGSVASTVFDWHPSGPLFSIFAFGTVASVPAGPSDVPVALAVSGASAVLAVVIGNIGAVARRAPRASTPPLRAPRYVDPLRYLLVVLLAGGAATAAGIGHPWWAMVAAAAPSRSAVASTSRCAPPTASSAPCSACCWPLRCCCSGSIRSRWCSSWSCLQVVTELVVGRNYGIAMLFITPMALLMGQLGASQGRGALLFDRGVETFIGVVVALALIAVEHGRDSVAR